MDKKDELTESDIMLLYLLLL